MSATSGPIDDGGPAFPNTGEGLGREFAASGMTLRDYLAATSGISFRDAALCANGRLRVPATLDEVTALLVVMRLAYADAMLKARSA